MPKSTAYPPPLIIPAQFAHTQTIIILHGRGSTASEFAPPLLQHLVSAPRSLDYGNGAAPQPITTTTRTDRNDGSISSKEHGYTEDVDVLATFQSHFPNAKFIFPTASLRRARAYNRSMTHQWFDQYPLTSYLPSHKQDIQVPGLRESVTHIRRLVREATQEVGAGNVALVGLSQGCAVALCAVLAGGCEGLGRVVGLCGWLPLWQTIEVALGGDEENEDGDDDPFERDAEEIADREEKSRLDKVALWLQEELELDQSANEQSLNTSNTTSAGLPVFLGHGTEDEVVPCGLGRQAFGFLKDTGLDARWHEYDGLGHWYSADMLRDVVTFLRSKS